VDPGLVIGLSARRGSERRQAANAIFG